MGTPANIDPNGVVLLIAIITAVPLEAEFTVVLEKAALGVVFDAKV